MIINKALYHYWGIPAGLKIMILWCFLPLFVFFILLWLEKKRPIRGTGTHYTAGDWLLNISGFFMQGIVIPLTGYCLATQVLPFFFPAAAGILPLGIIGAFLLNVIGIDFLYYLQHRAFHGVPWLWKLHATHHYSPRVDIWTTSRNALLIHFLFVYTLINPVLGYLCDAPGAFFAGAMVTAALDVLRHSRLRLEISFLKGIWISPRDHHRHHDGAKRDANFGANLAIWDRMFRTADLDAEYPLTYTVPDPPRYITQLLFPWKG
jgi:sterol desaturase/sphingolipid hydroxylase (fatty acid hydroxylase superfamily)